METLIGLYIASAVVATGIFSWERGSRSLDRYHHEPRKLSDYSGDDFLAAVVLGALGPVTLFTVVPYICAGRLKPFLQERRERLERARQEQERQIAAHMPEVEKALGAGDGKDYHAECCAK